MSEQLRQSMFHDVFFPHDKGEARVESFHLQRSLRFVPDSNRTLGSLPVVVFDFETTGLKPGYHEIIEIGAIRYLNGKKCDQYSTLINPTRDLAYTITKITGITQEMLADQPTISEVWQDFLRFIDGSVLVAHNADFDAAFLKATCEKLNYCIDYPIYCTLKMARQRLSQLKKRTLDSLAEFFGLEFSSRHRSIGDAEVTAEVMKKILGDIDNVTLRQLDRYRAKR